MVYQLYAQWLVWSCILLGVGGFSNWFPSTGRQTTKQILCSSLGDDDDDDFSSTIRCDRIPLSDGASMQVLFGFPSKQVKKPKNVVLLFLHGSFHGSWCWQEHFLPHFVDAGYAVVAPDWRGTGGTPAAPGARKVQIAQHVQDLHSLLEQLPEFLQQQQQQSGATKAITDPRPVIVAHSFGGVALMKHLEEHSKENPFRGVATFCSVPPSGNGQLTLRYLRRSLRSSWIITRGFAMKKCITDENLCRQLFFGGPKRTKDNGQVDDFGVSDEELLTYQENFRRDSAATIDLLDLSKKLPSLQTDTGKKAMFVDDAFPPCLVVGASDDYVVDAEAVEETANYFGASSAVMVDSPHDIMLGRNWMNAATVLETWLDRELEK